MYEELLNEGEVNPKQVFPKIHIELRTILKLIACIILLKTSKAIQINNYTMN